MEKDLNKFYELYKKNVFETNIYPKDITQVKPTEED